MGIVIGEDRTGEHAQLVIVGDRAVLENPRLDTLPELLSLVEVQLLRSAVREMERVVVRTTRARFRSPGWILPANEMPAIENPLWLLIVVMVLLVALRIFIDARILD